MNNSIGIKFAHIAIILIYLSIASCGQIRSRGTDYYIKEYKSNEINYSKVSIFKPYSFWGAFDCFTFVLDDNFSNDPKSIIVLGINDRNLQKQLSIYGDSFEIFYPDPDLNRKELICKKEIFKKPNVTFYSGTHIGKPISWKSPTYDSILKMLNNKNEKVITYREYLIGTDDEFVEQIVDGKIERYRVVIKGGPKYILLKKFDIIGEIGRNGKLAWNKKPGISRVAVVANCVGHFYSDTGPVSFSPNHNYEYMIDTSYSTHLIKRTKDIQ